MGLQTAHSQKKYGAILRDHIRSLQDQQFDSIFKLRTAERNMVARYPVGDKPEECDSTRENSSKHSGRGDGGGSGGGGGGNVGGIICQRCQDVKRGPLKRIQVCEYCKEWKRLEALLPSQVRRKTPTEKELLWRAVVYIDFLQKLLNKS